MFSKSKMTRITKDGVREGGREREMEREREQRTPLDAGFNLRVVLPEDD